MLNSITNSSDYKKCCTTFYEDDLISFFFGESFHPGGVKLTKELGKKLGLSENSKVLDLACGKGTSAIILAEKFGCNVIGVDLSHQNIEFAQVQAKEMNLDSKLKLHVEDAQKLPFSNTYFDAVIAECSFCIFPAKNKVMQEIYRILQPGGVVGFSDITVEKKLPYDLSDMIYRVACLSDAQSVDQYLKYFKDNKFGSLKVEDNRDVIIDLYRSLKRKVFTLQVAKNLRRKELKNIDLKNIDFSQLNQYIDRIKEFVDFGYGSYVLLTGRK